MPEESWYRVVSFFDENKGRKIDVNGNVSVRVLGEVGSIVVVQLPKIDESVHAVLQAARSTLEDAGIESAIFIPEGVTFLRLEKADPPVPDEEAR